MRRVNLVEIETRWGYRTVELYCGDLTKIDVAVDVLAVSSYARNYAPVPGTLIGALHSNCNISVLELSKSCEYDFRESLGCWIVRVNSGAKFKRIVCVDIVGGRLQVNELVENLFVALSILEMKGVAISNVALPVLGAGNQSLDPEEMIKVLLSTMQKHRDQFRELNQVLFVDINEDRAARLDRAINEQLGRIKLVLPRGQVFDGLRKDLGKSLDAAEALAGVQGGSLFSDLRRLVNSDQSRWFEIGMVSRRMVEFMVKTILPPKEVGRDLEKSLERLPQHGIANWITSYMHVLRIFGNESVHHRETGRQPASISQTDIALSLFCVQRLLDFWVEFERTKREKAEREKAKH